VIGAKCLRGKQGSEGLHGIAVKEIKVVSCYTPERYCQYFATYGQVAWLRLHSPSITCRNYLLRSRHTPAETTFIKVHIPVTSPTVACNMSRRLEWRTFYTQHVVVVARCPELHFRHKGFNWILSKCNRKSEV
jgi:hypothetical protein